MEHEEPKSYKEAIKSKEKASWLKAMNKELHSPNKNQTWTLVERPKNQRVVGCIWLFKRKEGIPGSEQPSYKTRLVAKGYSQVQGVDFNEIYSPVVKHYSITIILSLVPQFDLELEQLDVKTAFLHGDLEETIYMDQPEGIKPGTENLVCLLKKSLYGLRQSPRQWYKRFDEFMLGIKFIRYSYDSCVYLKMKNDQVAMSLLLYVDDMLIASRSMQDIQELKQQLNSKFELKDLG